MARPTRPMVDERICLHAVAGDGRLVAGRLVSTRRHGVTTALAGQPISEIPTLLSRLFPLCGSAHAIAAATAFEAALGTEVSAARRAVRELLVLAEHANALAWRTLMQWTELAGGSADVAAYATFRSALAPIMALAEKIAAIGGATLRVCGRDIAAAVSNVAALTAALFPETRDPILSFPVLERAIGPAGSVPARLIETVRAGLPARYGAHNRPLFASAGADWFAARLTAVPEFSAAPTLDGVPAEVGPLAAARHPLVVEAVTQWGPALATRLLAAALDISVVAERLRDAGQRLADDDAAEIDLTRTGRGAGVVETARGPLAYYVEIEAGRVRLLRSVAPTEWNFHADGPFLAALEQAPAVADPVAAVRLLAASFDPCVPFDVELASVRRQPTERLLHA